MIALTKISRFFAKLLFFQCNAGKLLLLSLLLLLEETFIFQADQAEIMENYETY